MASPRARIATLAGLVGFASSIAWSWVPSYWSDEVATLRAVRLGWSELIEFVQYKDAVHFVYYVVAKGWISLFGESELGTRSLSAFAIGLTAAGIVVLGSSMGTDRMGAIAGVVFTVLPKVTYMGAEARSYALTAMLAVWVTVVFVGALRHRRPILWVVYGVLLIVAIHLFIYLALMVAVHGAYMLSTRSSRAAIGFWAASSLGAVVVSTPIVIIVVGQREQIAWLLTQDSVSLWTVVVEPAFDGSWLFALIALSLLIVGAVSRRRVQFSPSRELGVLVALWVLVPLLLLLVADAVAGPLYSARYLFFSTPAIALLISIAIEKCTVKRGGVIIVGVLMLASLPSYASQRHEFSKHGGSDLRQVADIIHTQSSRGDSFLLANSGNATLRPRQALYAYPGAFAGLQDVAFVAPFTEVGTFSDKTAEPDQIRDRLGKVHTLWVVTPGLQPSKEAKAEASILVAAGLTPVEQFRANRSLITKYER